MKEGFSFIPNAYKVVSTYQSIEAELTKCSCQTGSEGNFNAKHGFTWPEMKDIINILLRDAVAKLQIGSKTKSTEVFNVTIS